MRKKNLKTGMMLITKVVGTPITTNPSSKQVQGNTNDTFFLLRASLLKFLNPY